MPWYQRLWESLSGFFYENWQRILIFALVLVVGFIVVKLIIAFSGKVMKKSKLNNAAGDFLLSVIKALLYIVYIIALLSLLGVPTTSLSHFYRFCAGNIAGHAEYYFQSGQRRRNNSD